MKVRLTSISVRTSFPLFKRFDGIQLKFSSGIESPYYTANSTEQGKDKVKWIDYRVDPPDAVITQIRMKKDYPFEMFVGLQLLDADGRIVLNIDQAQQDGGSWLTQNVNENEEIIGIYGSSDSNDFLRSLGFVLWTR